MVVIGLDFKDSMEIGCDVEFHEWAPKNIGNMYSCI